MPDDDHTLASALWLVAGGMAGYAAGRFVIGPSLAGGPEVPLASNSTAIAPRPAVSATRALVAGPSGVMQPHDPYGVPAANAVVAPHAGPSGQMQPRDPYGDAAPSVVPVASQIASGPITMPSELPLAASPSTSGPITSPLQAEPALPDSALVKPAMPPSASGPITSPSQPETRLPDTALVKPATPRGFATKSRVRRFDPVFARYRGELPIEYVRALVERESDGQPSERTGSAIGLMQIVPVVLADYNKRHGTAYGSEHLTDPAINVAIGCELLRRIIANYRKHHPRIRALQADWSNPRFVELLTFGWNAGYSEAGGLGRVVRYLERLGARDVDVDLVAAHAKLAGATKHLSNPAKLAWSKGVAALYQRERAAAARTPFASS